MVNINSSLILEYGVNRSILSSFQTLILKICSGVETYWWLKNCLVRIPSFTGKFSLQSPMFVWLVQRALAIILQLWEFSHLVSRKFYTYTWAFTNSKRRIKAQHKQIFKLTKYLRAFVNFHDFLAIYYYSWRKV